MRFKVGNVWFTASAGSPIMVEFSGQDKANIQNMDESATKYAVFRSIDGLDDMDIVDWMESDDVSPSLILDNDKLNELCHLASQKLPLCVTCEGEGSMADGLDEAACSTACPECNGSGVRYDEALKLAFLTMAAKAHPDHEHYVEFVVTENSFTSRTVQGEVTAKQELEKLVDHLGPRFFLDMGWFPLSLERKDKNNAG